MHELSFSYQNIIDGQGFSLAFAGMTIVFTALILVSAFTALLPKILKVVNRRIPEVQHHPQKRKGSDEAAVAAAIGFALHARRQGP
jgi:Na+-transporting methylmalonyl-CoA/oxaloacetate decarboxylase gamma subunit